MVFIRNVRKVTNEFRQESKSLQKQIEILEDQLQQDKTQGATGVTQEVIKEQRTKGPSTLTQQATEKMAKQAQVEAYQEFGQQQAGMYITNSPNSAAGSIGVKDTKRAGTVAAVDPALASAARPSDSNPVTTKFNLPRDFKMDTGHGHNTLLSNSSGSSHWGMAGSGGIDQDMPAAQRVEKQTIVDEVADQMINGQSNAGLSGVPSDVVGTGQATDAYGINRDTVVANVAAGTGFAPTRSTISTIAVEKQADVKDISGVSMAISPTRIQQEPELFTVDVTIILSHQEDRFQQQATATKIQQPHQQQLQQYQ